MQYATFFKKQSIALIDTYQQRFIKTIGQAVLWTSISFVIIAIISAYTNYDPTQKTQPVSILSFFTIRFSLNETYSTVDNAKSVFVFFVSIFSIKQAGKTSFKNIACLVAILLVCCLLDMSFFRLKGQLHHVIDNHHVERWTTAVIYMLRLFMPLILFALTTQICTSGPKFTARKIMFLFLALYLFNEGTFEIVQLIRACIFELLLSGFDSKTVRFIAESILGVGLMAVFVVGYHCVMTGPFVLKEEAGEDVEESIEA